MGTYASTLQGPRKKWARSFKTLGVFSSSVLAFASSMASCVGIQGQVGLQFIVMLSQDGRGYRSAVVSEFDETRVRAWAADTIAKNMDRMMKKTVTQYMPNTIRANTRLSTCAEHRGRSTRSDVASRRRRPVDSRGIKTTASWRRCLVKTPSTRPLSL